jgi:hypothetical protein
LHEARQRVANKVRNQGQKQEMKNKGKHDHENVREYQMLAMDSLMLQALPIPALMFSSFMMMPFGLQILQV